MKLVCVYSILCVLATAKDCSLYDNFHDSQCFWEDELTAALTWSSNVWMVEFYSSWCGHCQHFAPIWKEVASRVKGWSGVLRSGQIDCSQSVNSQTCRKYRIMAYPSVKFVSAYTNDPVSSELQDFIGERSVQSIVDFTMNYLLKTNILPSLKPLQSTVVEDGIMSLVFETRNSMLGMEIVLDLLQKKDIQIRRVLDNNTALVKKYSILHFPSLVILFPDEKYIVVSGKSAGDKRTAVYFLEKLNQLLDFPRIGYRQKLKNGSWALHSPSQDYQQPSRPTDMDIRSAISYSLRMEIRMHHLISDKSFFVLLQFISHLEKNFQFSDSAIAFDMRAIRVKLESKSLARFILASEWDRLLETKLKKDTFPIEPKWSACTGSLPQYRGYPCGLWSLMHSVTVLSLSLPGSIEYRPVNMRVSSRESLYAVTSYIKHFFSCEECRKHFSELAETLRRRPISYDGDAILWLWEAHNIVSKRLQNEESTDPSHPKKLFPPLNLCPDCYIVNRDLPSKHSVPSWIDVKFLPGESLLQSDLSTTATYYWNRSAVFLFLTNFYGMDHLNEIPLSVLLSAAWPKMFPLSPDRHYPHKIQTSYSNSNFVIIIVQFIACILLMACLISFTLRYKMVWHSSRTSLSRYKML